MLAWLSYPPPPSSWGNSTKSDHTQTLCDYNKRASYRQSWTARWKSWRAEHEGRARMVVIGANADWDQSWKLAWRGSPSGGVVFWLKQATFLHSWMKRHSLHRLQQFSVSFYLFNWLQFPPFFAQLFDFPLEFLYSLRLFFPVWSRIGLFLLQDGGGSGNAERCNVVISQTISWVSQKRLSSEVGISLFIETFHTI